MYTANLKQISDSVSISSSFPYLLKTNNSTQWLAQVLVCLFTASVPAARCPDNTFTCDNGECVTKFNPECDFVSDCVDGSDEARCCT